MNQTELERRLEASAEALEQQRIEAADLASALAASELQVADLQRRLQSAGAAGDHGDLRAELERQKAAAEEYRVEAADLRSMFDAMQHRIEVLQKRTADAGDDAQLTAAREESQRLAARVEQLERELESVSAAQPPQHATADEKIADLESKLVATRKARDQWLERLEQSGKEKQELHERVAELERQLAESGGLLQSIADLEADRDGAREQLDAAQQRAAAAEQSAADTARKLEQVEAAVEAAAARAENASADLDAQRAKVVELEELLEQADREIEGFKQERAGHAAELEKVEEGSRAIAALRQEIEAGQQRIVELEAGLTARDDQATRAGSDAAAASERIAALESELAERDEALQSTRTELDERQQRIVALERELDERRESAAVIDDERARIAELEADLAAGERRIEEIDAERAAAIARIAEADTTAASATERLQALEVELGASRERVAGLEAELDSTRDQAGELDSALSGLRALLESSEAAREASTANETDTSRLAEELDAELSAARQRAAELEQELEAVRAELASEREGIAAIAARWEAADRQGEDLVEAHSGLRADLAALRDDLGALSTLSRELESGVGDDRERFALVEAKVADRKELDGELTILRERIAELEAEVDDATAADEVQQLRESLADTEAQRRALAEEIGAERERSAQLEQELEESRAGNDAAEREGLDAELVSLRASFDDAVKNHAEEVRVLRGDVELQTSLARDRENELNRLTEECAILQQSVEDAISELDGVRAERKSLSEQLSEIEDVALREQEALANGEVGEGALALEGGLTSAAAEVDGILEASLLEATVADCAAESSTGGALVVHIDGSAEMRAAVEDAVGKVKGAAYSAELDPHVEPGGSVRLVANLAADELEIDTLADADRWGLDDPEAILYCAKDGRGVFMRNVALFPPPGDLDECSARLLAGCEDLQRLLAVGEDVDFMSGLRESLGRVRCSTAIAFDGRQVVDLIPMVKPQVVLVDLNLPRGGGLRVAAQIAANPDLRNVSLAMFWRKPVDPVVFRQQAIFAMRDFYLSPEDLTRGIARTLGDSVARNGAIPLVGAASSNLAGISSQAGR